MATAKQNVFNVIRGLAATSAQPLTATALYKRADIKKVAKNVEKVSNALGTLYRSGTLKRVAAPTSRNSRAKFAYLLAAGAKAKISAKSKTQPTTKVAEAKPTATPKAIKKGMRRAKRRVMMSTGTAGAAPVAMRGHKPTVRIHQSGENVVLEMPNMRIVIALT